MSGAGPRRLSHDDDLYDDLNPRSEHAEAMEQWQSPPLRRMWAVVFGLALWHSGDSAICGGRGGLQPASPITLLISLKDNWRRRAQDRDLQDGQACDV